MHRRDAVTQTLAPWGSRAPQRDRMTRRTLCVLGALAAFPLRSQGRPVARIGVVHHDRRGDPVVESFFRRLAQLGWVEGRNLGVEYHHIGTGLRGLAPIVQAIVRLKCNLVVAYNTPAALAFKAEAPSMPMIFVIGGDPVALGLVESWARPGGNATGVTGPRTRIERQDAGTAQGSGSSSPSRRGDVGSRQSNDVPTYSTQPWRRRALAWNIPVLPPNCACQRFTRQLISLSTPEG